MRRTAEMAEVNAWGEGDERGERLGRGRRERRNVEKTLARIPEYPESKKALAKPKLM